MQPLRLSTWQPQEMSAWNWGCPSSSSSTLLSSNSNKGKQAMAQPTVFVTRKIADEAIRKLSGQARVETWQQEDPPPYTVLLEKAASVDGLLTLLTDRIDAPLIDAARNLKAISQMAVGFDNIDIE